MHDTQKAQDSMVKIREAGYSLEALTRGERGNLVNMMEDWWISQGWDIDELRNPYQTTQNKN